jgi:hypothetical protein
MKVKPTKPVGFGKVFSRKKIKKKFFLTREKDPDSVKVFWVTFITFGRF